MGGCTHGSHPFVVYSQLKGGSPDAGGSGTRHPAGHPNNVSNLHYVEAANEEVIQMKRMMRVSLATVLPLFC